MKRIKNTYLAALAVLLSPMAANADIIVTVSEVGSDIIVAQTGTLDFTGGIIFAGPSAFGERHRQFPGTAPSFAGFNSLATVLRRVTFTDESTPDAGAFTVGLFFSIPGTVTDSIGLLVQDPLLIVYVPHSSSSGSPIDSSYTILDQSFATLGLTAGQTATWNLNNGDSVSWKVGTQNVPEPGTLALLGLGLAGIGFARRKKV